MPANKFTIIKFTVLPPREKEYFKCVPSSWIDSTPKDERLTTNDKFKVLVHYPALILTRPQIKKIIENGSGPDLQWPLWPCVSIIDVDSYEKWQGIQSFIKSNPHFDDMTLIAILNTTSYDDDEQELSQEGEIEHYFSTDMSFSEASTSRQSHEAENRKQLMTRNDKTISKERRSSLDVIESKKSKKNDLQQEQRDDDKTETLSPKPSTSGIQRIDKQDISTSNLLEQFKKACELMTSLLEKIVTQVHNSRDI